MSTKFSLQTINTSNLALPTDQERYDYLLTQGNDEKVASLIAPVNISHQMARRIYRVLEDQKGQQNAFLALFEYDNHDLGIFKYLVNAQRPNSLDIPQEGTPEYLAHMQLLPFRYESMVYMMNTLLGAKLFEASLHQSGNEIDLSVLMSQKISKEGFEIIWESALEAIDSEEKPKEAELAKQNIIDGYFCSETSILIRTNESFEFFFGCVESAIFYVLKYFSAVSTAYASSEQDRERKQAIKLKIVEMAKRLEKQKPDVYSLEGQMLRYLNLLTRNKYADLQFDNAINETPFPITKRINGLIIHAQLILNTKLQSTSSQERDK